MHKYFAGPIGPFPPIFAFILAAVYLATIITSLVVVVRYWKRQKTYNPNSFLARKGSKVLVLTLIAASILAVAFVVYRYLDSSFASRRQESYKLCNEERYGNVPLEESSPEWKERFSSSNPCQQLLRKKWSF